MERVQTCWKLCGGAGVRLARMHVDELPERTQDYLKTLWNFEEHHGVDVAMPLGELARSTGQKLPACSEAVKRLHAKKLVSHERYAGARLTETGRSLAAAVARRHRLLESFLVTTLGYTWDEVHVEADQLEHACSDRFIDRLDNFLDHPARDPHGDPIPGADGTAEPLSARKLADVPADETVTMEQVDDADPELLRFLDEHGMRPGTQLTVTAAPAAGLMHVSVDGTASFALAEIAARDIAVH